MYDTLEGLDYKPGECAYYVSKILFDISSALEKGEVVYKEQKDIKIGDVCIDDFSSHLVTRTYDQYRIKIRHEQQKILVIPKEVLDKKRQESI